MKKKHAYIRNFLFLTFSADIGLSHEAQDEDMKEILGNPAHRKEFEQALRDLFADKDVDWVELLDNDDYAVSHCDDQDDARDYVVQYFWKIVFPNEPEPG